jgi:hypothetical protein
MSGCLRGISAAQGLFVFRRHRSHRWHCHRHSRAVPFRVAEPPIIFQQEGFFGINVQAVVVADYSVLYLSAK